MAIPGYRILRKIRQGGMSTVYLAIQQSVDREVAIKVMSPNLNSDPSFSTRFYREAKIVGKLSHPNIVSIYDVGNHKHYNYIAMDFLPGMPLQDRLDQGVSVEQAIRIIREMASALNYAHERGYVHRDVKPDNILFREDDSAVLCDFGIAKALKGSVKMTNFGSVLGTPNYMSPEQAQGKEIDGRADIYSLGVVFYEMLTGQVPFSGDDPVAIAVKHMTSAIPKLPAEHKSFQNIIEKMMDKKAANRFQTGAEVITALDELEKSLTQGTKQLTQSGSTTLQMLGLIGALFNTLTTAVTVSVQRLLLSKNKFTSQTVQLSEKQQQDLDSFILNDDSEELPEHYADLPLIQDTIEQAAVGFRWSRIVIPCLIVIAISAGAFYFWPAPHQQPIPPAAIAAVNEAAPIDAAESTTMDTKISEDADSDTEPSTETDIIAEVTTEPEPMPEFALTVDTQPDDAIVRILNIKPRYRDGILLNPGNYHIKVSAKHYFPETFWIKIADKNVQREVNLQPTRRLLAAGTVIQDKLASGGDGPAMVVQTRTNDLAIALSQHEITFAQYDQYAQHTEQTLPDDAGWGRENRPVVSVNFTQAKAYAKWLSEQTGEKYRLPNQAEWQHASKAGSDSAYWWGQERSKDKANCRKGCNSEFSKFFSSSTAPVGTYPANPYGLFDTAGNVAEWLDECSSTNVDNSCETALVAGGSHKDPDKEISSDSIKTIKADTQSDDIGFRLLLEL
ncbi:bifunctional serine/threonine-protein kinase/formylglycine-generating enzyme family protein [Oceanicoccus sp. KOV_DT_Chl]|uniref:bifunctional serine/threonine-protein kinase/formylglycine-generating enzyme family protein n=1 Tax=Oceanicoccus sp. KOV_DT_Chl TaxID=1904639 RepID=UPI000C7E4636|nr:bifunctional serine/threonine-protein kinase/formylglycine-generating enzyme family protein [Oceanicoccus sp. KOV_DT_Chl]